SSRSRQSRADHLRLSYLAPQHPRWLSHQLIATVVPRTVRLGPPSMLIVRPWIVSWPVAFKLILPFESRLMLPLASRLMSPATSMLSLLVVESSLIVFLPVLSTMVMAGLSESSIVIVWPRRDLMTRRSTLPVGPTTFVALSGGFSRPFHKQPMTYGKF